MSQPQSKVSRRTLFAGAGTAGAIAAAATLVPRVMPQALEVPALPQAPAQGGGYQLSEHVKLYYKTART